MIDALITKNEIRRFINQAVQCLDTSINEKNISTEEFLKRHNISRYMLRKYLRLGMPYNYTKRHQYVFDVKLTDAWTEKLRMRGKIK